MDVRKSSSKFKPSGDLGSIGVLFLSKLIFLFAIFLSYDILVQVPVVVFLFVVKSCCGIAFVFLQRPITSGKRLSVQSWLRVARHSVLIAMTSLLWTCGLSFCGPLRTVLLWEHSPIVVLAIVNIVLSLGQHHKARGGVLFMAGMVCLILFDNDHLSHADHPEGTHSSVLTHFLYHFISVLGVPDHKGGVVLLLIGLFLNAFVSHLQRTLAVQIGGQKRLNALVTLLTALSLVPFATAQMWISEIWDDVVSQFPYMVIVSMLFVVHFYMENSVQSKLDTHRIAKLSSLSMFCGALVLTFLWIAPIDHGLVHHMSFGVVMSAAFFLCATPILNKSAPTRSKDGSSLPLYLDEGRLRPSEKIKDIISRIVSSRDSRNIFYFLCLNLSFTFVEFFYGFWSNSLGLISDGFHMLFDCTALVLGLYAAVASQWKSNKVFSYGYGRMEILSGFINGLFLLTIAFYVFMEAVDRLVDPPHVDSNRLLVVSIGGLVVNLIGIVAFRDAHAHAHGGQCSHSHTHSHSHSHSHSHTHHHSHSHSDKHSHHHHSESSHPNANMQGIFLHVLADTLGSVAVIISSLLIQQFGWHIADPICSLFLSGLIFLSVIPLLKGSLKTLLLVPSDYPRLQKCLEKLHHIEGVVHYSHAHFWQLSSSSVVGTINIQVTQSCNEQKIIHTVVAHLKECGVSNLAVQVEKEPFCSSSIARSTRQHSGSAMDITLPEIYVDYGPVATGNII